MDGESHIKRLVIYKLVFGPALSHSGWPIVITENHPETRKQIVDKKTREKNAQRCAQADLACGDAEVD